MRNANQDNTEFVTGDCLHKGDMIVCQGTYSVIKRVEFTGYCFHIYHSGMISTIGIDDKVLKWIYRPYNLQDRPLPYTQ